MTALQTLVSLSVWLGFVLVASLLPHPWPFIAVVAGGLVAVAADRIRARRQ